ncbi:MAG: hypothetical protein HUJ31_07960 [Pseudomonadales bacterium]|nr:hypothetical protein [Pseudomonadales bacterium]
MEFLEQHEYAVAWTVYVLAGIGCMVVWWKITSRISPRALRDFLRGTAIVITFTPWYAGQSPEFFAPAIVVLLMDILLEGTKSGVKGGVVLLIGMLFMLAVLIVREIRRRPTGPQKTGS